MTGDLAYKHQLWQTASIQVSANLIFPIEALVTCLYRFGQQNTNWSTPFKQKWVTIFILINTPSLIKAHTLSFGKKGSQMPPVAKTYLKNIIWATSWQNQQNEKTHFSLGIHQSFFRRTAKTLTRLVGCPGWSESLLSALVILLVLSWGGSF